MWTIYIKEKANTRVIYYVVKWREHVCWQSLLLFRPLCLIVFLFCLHFCILSHFEINRLHCEIIDRYFDAFFVELPKFEKCFFGHQNSGAKTGIPVSWTAWISHWNFYNSIESTDVLNKIKWFSSRRRLLFSGKHSIAELFLKLTERFLLKAALRIF